jgi:hypothetical protein
MKIQSELPTVLAFSSNSFRRAVLHMPKGRMRVVLKAIKEALIMDQSFMPASEIREAEKEFLPVKKAKP